MESQILGESIMAKSPLHNIIEYLINGSGPSLMEAVSEELTQNFLVIEGCLFPFHGKIKPISLNGRIQKIYKSWREGTVYVFANNVAYTLSSLGTLSISFRVPSSSGYIQVDENNNNELGITTGTALYVFNYGTGVLTQIPTVTSDGFLLKNPNSIICISTFFFIADAYTGQIQISAANAGTVYNPVQLINFTSNADNIQTLAQVERVMFVIGDYSIERWTITGNTGVVTRDDVFLEPYGVYDINSFVNKLNIFIGAFASKEGGIFFKKFENGRLETIASPGMTKRILASGNIVNSDVYEIDSYRYYEVATDSGQTFIYNLTTNKWTETTSGFEQVVYFNGAFYGAYKDFLYTLDLYNTQELKKRYCPPAFPDADYDRFTMGQFYIWFTNPKAVSGKMGMYASVDGVTDMTDYQQDIDGSNYYSVVSRAFNNDCFQFGLKFETYLNVIIRAGFASWSQKKRM